MVMNSYGLAVVHILTKRYDQCEQDLRGKNAYRSSDLVHAEEYFVQAFDMCDRGPGRKRHETQQLNDPLVTLYQRRVTSWKRLSSGRSSSARTCRLIPGTAACWG